MRSAPDVASLSPARVRRALRLTALLLSCFADKRGMETNCRKLVSACVQLGKIPLLPSGSPDRQMRQVRAARSGRSPRGADRGWKTSGPWTLAGLSLSEGGDSRGGRGLGPAEGPGSVLRARTAGGAPARGPHSPAPGCHHRVLGMGVPFAFCSNWVFALCPSFFSVLPRLASPRPAPFTPTPSPAPFGRAPGRPSPPHVGAGSAAAQACSPRPLNASSPKTPKSKRSSSQTLPRAGKRQRAASSSRGSIPAPMVRPGGRRRPRAGHPPPGLWGLGEKHAGDATRHGTPCA